MNFVRLLPVLLSALLLGAHFLRRDAIELVVVALCVPLVLLVRRPWAAWVVRIGLLVATLEWLRTLMHMVEIRRALDEPFGRLVAILASVAAFTLLSTLVFQSKSLARRYRLRREPAAKG